MSTLKFRRDSRHTEQVFVRVHSQEQLEETVLALLVACGKSFDRACDFVAESLKDLPFHEYQYITHGKALITIYLDEKLP